MLPQGQFNEQDIVMYRNLIKQVSNESIIIVVGIQKGKTICSISDLIKEKKLKVIAIDTFTYVEENTPEEQLRNLALTLDNFGIKQQVEIHVGTFQDYYTNNKNTINVSCIYINDNEVTEDVRKNYETALNVKKLNPYCIIAGYKADLESVKKALPSNVLIFNKTWKIYNKSTCAVISTKGRTYSSLPISLSTIINQTVVPDEIIIFDDNDVNEDLRNNPLYSNLFALAYKRGINLQVVFGEKKGQVYNYKNIYKVTKCSLIWRVDDDLIPAPNSLELLKIEYSKDKIVAGYIYNNIEFTGVTHSLDISNINNAINSQWVRTYKKDFKADHLYSSYLYQKGVGVYENLSPICFREETIHTLTAKYIDKQTLIYLPSVEAIHLGDALGRQNDRKLVDFCKQQDEKIFQEVILKLGLRLKNYFILNSGIGDHYAFIKAVQLKGKEYLFKNSLFYVAWREPFENIVPKENIKSIEEAKLFGLNLDNHSIYKFMLQQDWGGDLVQAYINMYEL